MCVVDGAAEDVCAAGRAAPDGGGGGGRVEGLAGGRGRGSGRVAGSYGMTLLW